MKPYASTGLHGFPASVTSFVGRAQIVDEVAGLLAGDRLVTVTGPGGAGKTRLAGEVASRVADRFADGIWLAELAVVQDPAQVAAVAAAVLGVRELPLAGAADALAHALARRQLLLVLDNCEHVIGAAAELCGRLLLGADDVRILATSREPLRIAGEVRYRLGSLNLPEPGDPAAAASEAVTLFVDRARRTEPGFTLDEDTQAAAASLVTRLDGLPLAIELAAARVDALGVTQLLERIDDRFALLAEGDRLAQERQRSLAAAVRWSYQLLDDAERRAFRAVSVFPGPFTLAGAEAVAGPGANTAVLRLVDCSLLLPPRTGPDGRSRYLMLETLRAYGAGMLAEASEDSRVSAAFAAYAVAVAEDAVGGLHTRTMEAAGLRQMDAEEVTLRHALAWALEHDRPIALRLALAQASWWQVRGRLPSQTPLLVAAAEHADAGSDQWCAAQLFLGQSAGQAADPVVALKHYTAVRGVLEDPRRPTSEWTPVLMSLCLDGRSSSLLQMGRTDEATQDARRALDLAREVGSPGMAALAMVCLSSAAWIAGDRDGALRLAREAQRLPGEVAGALLRTISHIVAGLLAESGDLAAAEHICATALASCREVGDLTNLSALLWRMTSLDLAAGRVASATAHLHEQLELATRTALRPALLAGLDCCGHLCARTGRPAEAITLWAAMDGVAGPLPLMYRAMSPARDKELMASTRKLAGPAGTRAAQDRGAGMSLATAAEYALMLATEHQPTQEPGLARLSPRERELVTLVAQGRTDAQIATELYITVRTVSSHLDRIRDKTGCRRRADLTRLALSAGLV